MGGRAPIRQNPSRRRTQESRRRRQESRDELDPVEFEVVHAALLSVTDEMAAALRRSSYSPIIREMQDFSCGLFDEAGRLVVQGNFIPAQLGAMSLVVREVVARHGPTLAPDDTFIANDPYAGGAHTPDVNIVRPVFASGRSGRPRLLGFTGTVAHQVDFGGRNPGTEGADNRQIYEEGLIVPPVRLERAGEPVGDLFALIAANVRDPVSTVADLRAQVAACRAGERRLLEIVEERGAEVMRSTFRRAIDEAERRARLALGAIPDGTATAEGWLDDDGAGGPPTRLHVRLDKRGETLVVDLTGSAGQVAGALNNPWASTRACVAFLLRMIDDSPIEQNDGTLRAVEIICPSGSVLNPRPPAAVSVRHLTCQRLADVLVAAAARLSPDLAVGASWVGFFSLMAEGVSPKTGRPVVIQDVVGGGTGGHGGRGHRPGGAGIDGVDTYMSNVALLSAEVCETEYPWRLEESALVDRSEGGGRFPGGRGLRRTYRVLGDRPQAVVVYCDQTDPRFRPAGVAGGGDGAVTRMELRDPHGRAIEVSQKATVVLDPGSSVTIVTGGGGGWGRPEPAP